MVVLSCYCFSWSFLRFSWFYWSGFCLICPVVWGERGALVLPVCFLCVLIFPAGLILGWYFQASTLIFLLKHLFACGFKFVLRLAA